MSESLDDIRMDIDRVDNQLIDLLAKRLQLVEKIGNIKRKDGIPVRDVNREQSLLKKMSDKAIEKQVPVSLIEAIMPPIFHESYKQEHQKGYQRLGPKKIVIIGAKGKMGQLFYEYFSLSGYDIIGLDKDDDISNPKYYQDAGLVLIAVGISAIETVIKSLPKLPLNSLLADILSIKEVPMALMSAHHNGDVMGLHPLFGPSIDCMASHKMAYCIGKNQHSDWLLKQFTLWGLDLVELDASYHDKMMGIIQSLRFIILMALGDIINQHTDNIEDLKKIAPPPFLALLPLVQHQLMADEGLLFEIIQSNKYRVNMVNEFINCVNQLNQTDDLALFVKICDRIKRKA